MPLRKLAAVLALASAASASGACQVTDSPATPGPVHIRVTRPATPVTLPETLFGSFLEPIRQATYGGLWADPIENPSFEDGLWSANEVVKLLHDRPELHRASEVGLPLPWEPLDRSQGSRYSPIRGDAANSYQSLLIMSLPGKEVGILQRVYLPVQRQLTYAGAIWIKHVEGPAAVRISLRRRGQAAQLLAESTISASSQSWTKYPYTLTLPALSVVPTDPLDLVVSLKDDARAQVDNITLLPADAVQGMDPDVLALARDLHSPIVRFGGNFTSHYDWHDGIGPADKRISKLNLSWGIPEYNTFGTDEFLAFCKLIGASPQIALNLGTGTPQQAAEWVRYVNERWADHQGGLLWELGNELWGDFQVGYPSLQRVAAKTLATSQAIRAVDPGARLIATGGDEDFFHDWNAQQLTLPPDTFNYLSTHFVVTDRVQLPNAPATFASQAALALPWGLAERMQQIKSQIAASGRPEVKVAFTEWLMVSDTRAAPNFTNLGGALFAGGFLNMLLRNSDAVGISDMTGILEFGGIVKRKAVAFGTPAYWVLRAYATARPQTLLALNSDTPTYSITHGIQRLPQIANVPYLDTVAALSADGHTLILLAVNRSLTHALPAQIDLTALSVRKASAHIATITGDSILMENDESNPRNIMPMEVFEPVTPAWTHIFPSQSVTIIEIPIS